jgi:DNA-binding NarL/FixJ family response regulator
VRSRVRVLLVDVPTLLRQILEEAITRHPDLELVPQAAAATGTSPNERPTLDAVIVGADAAQAPDQASALLDRWPRAQVVMLTAAGRDAALYELRPHRTQLGKLSPVEALQAIRDAVRRRQPGNGAWT